MKCLLVVSISKKVDLYKSSADEFIIDGDSLIPPFNAIPSLGTNVAKQIVAARENGEFLSKEDLQQTWKSVENDYSVHG